MPTLSDFLLLFITVFCLHAFVVQPVMKILRKWRDKRREVGH